MGLSAAQARDALSLAPRAVMAHARQRRTMVQGVGVELLLPAVMEQAAPSAAAAGSAGTQVLKVHSLIKDARSCS